MNDLRKFARYFRPYKASLLAGIICIVAGVIFNLTIPLIVGRAVDENWAGVSWSKLTVSALKVLGASVASGIFLFLQRRILIGMSRHVEYDLRRDFYAHLVDQPLSFFQEHRVGDLMARASNDLAAVRQLAGPMIMYTLQTVFVVIFVLPLMLMLNRWLTLLLFVTMPLVSLTVKFFGQQVHMRFEKIQDFFAQITARAQENFTGVRVIRAYAQEGPEIAAFNQLNREFAEKNLSLVKIDALMRPDAVPNRNWFRLNNLGRSSARDSRRDQRRRLHGLQHVSLAPHLAPDRARLRSESLSTRNGQLETNERDPGNQAGRHRFSGSEGTAANQGRDRVSQSDLQISAYR